MSDPITLLAQMLANPPVIQRVDHNTYQRGELDSGAGQEMPQFNLRYTPWANPEEETKPDYTIRELDPKALILQRMWIEAVNRALGIGL